MNNDILKADERLDDLQYDGLKLIQNKNLYCFSSDAVLLCNFVKTKKSDMLFEIFIRIYLSYFPINKKRLYIRL